MAVRTARSASGVVTCTLDNPDRRNALTGEMLQALSDIYDGARQDGSLRAIVLRGGNGTFCAGRDLRELDAKPGEDGTAAAARIAPVTRLARAVGGCAVPTIAVVEGKAVGLGVALASWCDLAVAADDATFLVPEARAGIVPTYTAVSLARAVGRRNALALCLGGQPLGAREARAQGLVQQTWPAYELDERIDSLCEALALAGPQALRQCKALLDGVAGLPFDAALGRAEALSAASMESQEAREGMQALREKRRPAWASAPPPAAGPQ